MSLGFERIVLYLEPLDLGAARGGLDKAEKELNRGGLARAVCTEQAEDLTRINREVKPLQCCEITIMFNEICRL